IGHRQRYVQNLSERLREIRFARAGWADQQNLGLLQLDVVGRAAHVHALVMVVDRDRERLLGAFLTDHILIEDVIDFFGLWNVAKAQVLVDVLVELFLNDLVTELDTFVADVDTGAGDQLAYLLLRFTAEAALELPFLVPESKHCFLLGRRRQRRAILDDRVYNTVLLRLLGSHIEVPLDILKNLLDVFLGGLLVDSRQHAAGGDEVPGVDLDIGRLTTHLRDPRLVDQNLGVRQ